MSECDPPDKFRKNMLLKLMSLDYRTTRAIGIQDASGYGEQSLVFSTAGPYFYMFS